jgi:hypothetical protein
MDASAPDPPLHFQSIDPEETAGGMRARAVESLRPAQGHPVWFPQLHRYRCNPLEAAFLLIDDLGGWFQRGEALVVFARKK